jgi:hypothetical protein
LGCSPLCSRDAATLPNESAELVLAAASYLPDSLARLASTHTEHPTDTHPSLAARLAALSVDLDKAKPPSMQLEPEDAAIALIEAYADIEIALTEAVAFCTNGAAQR